MASVFDGVPQQAQVNVQPALSNFAGMQDQQARLSQMAQQMDVQRQQLAMQKQSAANEFHGQLMTQAGNIAANAKSPEEYATGMKGIADYAANAGYQNEAAGFQRFAQDPNTQAAVRAQTQDYYKQAGLDLQKQQLAAQQNAPVIVPYGSEVTTRNAVAKNGGISAQQPTSTMAPNEIQSKYNLVATPDEAQRFSAVPDKNKPTVAALLNGTQLLTGLPGGRYSQMGLDLVNQARSVDPNYDEVASKAGQTFETSKTTSQFMANARTANATADRMLELSNKLDRGNITLLNNGMLALKSGTSDPTAKDFLTTYNLLSDELGKILGSSQGSDFAIKLGQGMVDPNASKEAVAAQIAELKNRVANKLGEYKAQFRQGGTPTVATDTAAAPAAKAAPGAPPNRFDQLFGNQPGVQTAGAAGPDPAAVEAEMRRRGFL